MQAIITQPRPSGDYPARSGPIILQRPTRDRCLGAAGRFAPCRVELYRLGEPLETVYVPMRDIKKEKV
jgi:hypothetical protein